MNERAKRTTLAALLALAFLVPACKNGTETPRAAAAGEGGPTMDVRKELFGRLPDGTAVDIYTLTNKAGLEARVMTYGAILVSLKTPDRAGALADVNLGFDSLEGYLGTHPYFGAIIGRYGNRIAKGQFTLDGKTYQLRVDATPDARHSYAGDFQTSGDWQTVEIPFADLFAIRHGDRLDLPNYPGQTLAQIQILIGNGTPESFRLEIDKIWLR